nr:PQQ-dependent sugar dehydrogenase [Chloroflexia bacterium]
DQGSDWRGDDQPPEELNRIVEGGNYGWPYCFGDRQIDEYNSQTPAGSTTEQYCALTEAPAINYQAHSSPIGMVYYTADQFPADYQGDAFVAMRGSWNREAVTGYKIVHVQFDNGQPVAIDDFITGWLMEDGTQQFGRVAGLAVLPDGALLISEDANGVIYRVTYTGDD